jgi:hypothetical protein
MIRCHHDFLFLTAYVERHYITSILSYAMVFALRCSYVVSQSCQLALKNRPGVQPSYYSGIVNGGVRSGERAERSLDSEADQCDI